jgi:hypothetical protein
MSATGRGAIRIEHDHYPTPAWCTQILTDYLIGRISPKRILEPCSGEGKIVKMLAAAWPEAQYTTVDIRKVRVGGTTHYTRSFLEYRPRKRFDLAVTNPPYDENVLLPIIMHALSMADVTAMLLPLSWMFGSAARSSFRRSHPFDVLTLGGRRPAFARHVSCGPTKRQGCGWHGWYSIEGDWPRSCPHCGVKTRSSTTDASEYGWAIWGMGSHLPGEGLWIEGQEHASNRG